MFKNLFNFTLALSVAAVFGNFPDNIKRCLSSDDECLKNSFQNVLKNHYNGIREIGLIPFDPLRIKSLVLPKNPSSPVNIELTFTDIDVLGLKSATMNLATGFNFKERSKVELHIENMQLKGKYVLDGSVLILPINGKGDCLITGKDVILAYSFDMKPIDKNGVIYAELEHVKLQIKPQLIRYQFDNLFNGDKALGDSTNKFLNENWKPIYDEIEGGLTKALSLIVKQVISNVLNKVPYTVLFPEEA